MIESLSLAGLSWKELARRVWADSQEDNVLGRSAELSYYFLLALFPALLFLTALLGYLAGKDSELQSQLFRYLSALVPTSASSLINKTIKEVTQSTGGGKLSFGLLATLWAASNGMGAISQTLNVAYDVKESRPWWRVRLSAIALTLSLGLLIISALVLILYGHSLAEFVAGRFGLGEVFEWTWRILQWPIVLCFVFLAFALIYYVAPNVPDRSWKWITPGSIVGVVLWLLVSFGFKAYLAYFDSYSATYGSLGAVIVLLLWFYFTGAAILIGGEVNAEIEHELKPAGATKTEDERQASPDRVAVERS